MGPTRSDELSERHATELEKYQRLVELVQSELRRRLDDKEILVTGRAKTTSSFVKKAIRKQYTNPFEDTPDLAGARAIVYFPRDVPLVKDQVAEFCEVIREESKLDALEFNEFGYLGTHLETRPQHSFLEEHGAQDLKGLRCEIQIHTAAQSAWAVMSHDLIYKGNFTLPFRVRRGVSRLVALTELFDDEIERLENVIVSHPAFASVTAMTRLDDEIVRLTSRRPDPALTAILAPPLLAAYEADDPKVVVETVLSFVAENSEKLDGIYSRYATDDQHPLLTQPEVLLIFERLERDPDRLKETWPSSLIPVEDLTSLAAIWGVDI